MSRVGSNPINIPSGVDVKVTDNLVSVKGKNGKLSHRLHNLVGVSINDNILSVETKSKSKNANAVSGTTRSVINNMVVGVSSGFEKKLSLIGVGYRAQAKGQALNLTLGFSHPIDYTVPEGVTVETPSQTEIVVKGCNKQQVGQVAAEIRSYRPPEPYKGKGVRYADENVVRKEAKKK